MILPSGSHFCEMDIFSPPLCGEEGVSALAHTIGDKVEAAYRRGDLFDKRRKLMDAWAGFCATVPARGKSASTKI